MRICDGCGQKYKIGKPSDLAKLEVSEVFSDCVHVLFLAELCGDCRKYMVKRLEKEYFGGDK